MDLELTGILVPADWDDMGVIHSFALMTDDEGEHLLDIEKRCSELKEHVNKRVRVAGALKVNKKKHLIKVKKFSVLNY